MAESLDEMKYALAMRPTKQLDEHGLYSRAAEVARQLPQEKGTPQQMLAMIAKAKGVKPDEIKYSNVQNAFANNPTVSRDELAQYFEQERPRLTIDESQAKKFARYSTNGGEGYRANVYAMTSPMAFGGDRPIFQQRSHWDTTNPVVHHRTKEFNDSLAVKATKPKVPNPDKTLSLFRKDLNNREDVPAWSTSVNGLLIHKSLDNPKNYNITHDHSGLVIARDIPTYHGAQRAVKDLGVFTDWTLPRDEVVNSLKDPETNKVDAIKNIGREANDKNSDYHVILPTEADYAKAQKKYGGLKRHFLLDELQSDWGQTARKNGIKSPEEMKELEGLDSQYNELQNSWREANNKKYQAMNGMESGRTPEVSQFWTNEYIKFSDQTDSLQKKISELEKQRSDINKKMNDAPFIGNTQKWTDLGLKTALYRAAKGGNDTLAWTPGQVNADRYNLSNHVDEIHYNPERQQFFGMKKGRVIFNRVTDPQELEGLVGKEVAQKLLATEPVDSFHRLKGEDLSIGGKGMIDYYDNILPKRVLALAREHDPEAKLTSVRSPDENINGYHAIEITPTMRKSILENGFGVYRNGGTIHKASGGSILTRSKSMDTISPSVAQMRQALMNKQTLFNIQQTGVEQAPNMTPKMYISPDPTGKTFLPPGGVANKQGLPIGGVDMNTQQQGQQLNPQQPPQALPTAVKPPPQGAPQQPMPPPQGAPQQSQPSQGLPPPTGMLPQAPRPPMGNMLQMTPQGRAMGAMQPPQMASGGKISQDGMQYALMMNKGGSMKFKINPANTASVPEPDFTLYDRERPTTKSLGTAFEEAIRHHLSLNPAQRAANSARSEANIGQIIGQTPKGEVKDLLGTNVKLKKTGENADIKLPDGRGLETTGLALSPAFKYGSFTTCPNSASCAKECLGKTSGAYYYVGGADDLNEFKGPRLNSLKKTLAFLQNPHDFAVKLYEEINDAKAMAAANNNHLGVRLNVLSDIHPHVHKSIIQAHPDVTFYDYTKNNTNPVAENHHYTYSSTGVTQPDVENPNSNWKQMRKRLDSGDNVAMAFSDRDHLPEVVHDAETNKTYRVVNGDEHDFRPLDAQKEGANGVIIGLTNKRVSGSPITAHADSSGFFVHYDPVLEKDEKGKLKYRPDAPRNKSGRLTRAGAIPTNKVVTIMPQTKQAVNLTNDDGDKV